MLVSVLPSIATAADPKAWIDGELDDLVAIYKHFHEHPELSSHEVKTSQRVAEELGKLGGIRVTTNVGGHGVVGILENGKGPVVMVRGDMDALPIVEQTGLPYASQVTVRSADGVAVGVMHACGHDIHVTNLIGVGRYLAANKAEWSGTVMLVAQPAEETGAGAAAMLADGLFTKIRKPDYAIALHVDALSAAGTVGYLGGCVGANVDAADVTMRGRGGHGAFPQGAIDPIVQAAQLIVDLQTIVSREISPFDPAVITVGSIHAGTKHNIIPDSCHMQLTIRSYSDEVRKHLQDAIGRKARAIAKSHRAPEPIVEYSEGTPSLINSEQLAERLGPVFVRVLGKDKVSLAERSMGGEDFGRFGRDGVPILMYRLGSIDPKRLDEFTKKGDRPPSLHSALYYPEPRETLKTGLITMTAAVLELLPPKKNE